MQEGKRAKNMETKKAKTRTNILKISVIITVSLAVLFGTISAWAYTQVGDLNVRLTNLEAEKKTLRTQIGNLTAKINNMTGQIDALEASKLIQVNLNVEDVRPLPAESYLHISGEIVNVGTNPAYNSKLHVVAYQGLVLAIDTHIQLGTINGQSWITVDSNIPYSGSPIDIYTVVAKWTS